MSDLEKIIQSKKESLDTSDFSAEIWKSIEKQLPKKSTSKVRYLWWSAAAILVLSFSVFFGQLELSKSKTPIELLSENGIDGLSFFNELNKKNELIKTLRVPINQKRDFEIILRQLKTLDNQYLQYLQLIEQNGYQEHIGERIIEYYKTKIMMLDKIQQQIKEINYYEEKYQKQTKRVPLLF